MLAITQEELEVRAGAIIEGLKGLPVSAKVGEGRVQIGGGTLPKSVVPSLTIDLIPNGVSLEELARRLRRGKPPVIGYVSGRRYKIDLKTVFPRQDAEVQAAIHAALAERIV
jgi:L-seryl-tRNA(Ser) seleniumtransferase